MNDHNQRHRLLVLALIGILPFMFNGLVNSYIADNAALYWSFEFLTWIIIPSVIVWQVTRTPGLYLTDLGFHCSLRGRFEPGLLLIICILFAPICLWIYSSTYDYFSSVLPDKNLFDYQTIVPESGLIYYSVIIYFALSAGLVEEFLYRGLIFRALAGMRHAWLLFLLVSPILFSIVHWEDGYANLASTWVFGMFMALAYLGFRNLWPLVTGHFFTDFMLFG